ncbi:phosphatase PAP2 family protein [Candidatus Galacturonibacter soehngenii]|uniref:Phosphatase PAP2 family protein n=1 Tax=Candidatus Galacturonatibacter soehngenii TaxID=2307010 RepID=A0A7V7UG33_9FIRM|nr:phosphatase PAP2 family protein [Candidatus Galacturonibacter soehngenii]KAB1438086.1 phosphatase PAP2 family protein [Candidatus Galacturonibacter soehngenii]
MNLKEFLKKYKHAVTWLYFAIYLPWFVYLEKHVVKSYHVIHMDIDDKIPFNEVFIIPYMLWFAYVAVTFLYFFFYDMRSYRKMCLFLFSGMTIFLIISTVYPNGHLLRPTTFEHNNIFTKMVSALYKADTPTNLFPSIHVYNSIGTHLAIVKSDKLKEKKGLCFASFILMTLIIMSTVMLKQHSVFDVITAFIMAGVAYTLVYRNELILSDSKENEYQRTLS